MSLSERLAAAQQRSATARTAPAREDSPDDTRERLYRALGVVPDPAEEPVAETPPPVPPVEAAPPDPRGRPDVLVFPAREVDPAQVLPVPPGAPRPEAEPPREQHRGGRYVDPLAAIKRTVHQSLLDVLGPDAVRRAARRGRARRAGAPDPAAGDRRRRASWSAPPSGPASSTRSRTRSSATARSSRSCATRRSPRSWSTAPTRSTSSGRARCTRSTPRSPTTSHLRRTIDKIVGADRPARRRGEPDGGRPAARRQPRQRRASRRWRSTARC